MRPIPWNKAFRKRDGSLVNMEDIGGGGGSSELPEYSEADAGKVLGVDENGDLAWVTVSGGSNFGTATVEPGALNPTINAEEDV